MFSELRPWPSLLIREFSNRQEILRLLAAVNQPSQVMDNVMWQQYLKVTARVLRLGVMVNMSPWHDMCLLISFHSFTPSLFHFIGEAFHFNFERHCGNLCSFCNIEAGHWCWVRSSELLSGSSSSQRCWVGLRSEISAGHSSCFAPTLCVYQAGFVHRSFVILE